MSEQANYVAPDGYRYGVMFNDGSVTERWNGHTQRQRAELHAWLWALLYKPDNITLARRLPDGPWERVTE